MEKREQWPVSLASTSRPTSASSSRFSTSTASARSSPQEIVDKVGIPAERRVNQLTDAEVLQIREAIDRDYQVEGDLRRERVDEHQASDGPRLLPRPASSPRLPVRGQRTHTNARTRKGPAKAIAGKKK